MWKLYVNAASIEDVLEVLSTHQEKARVVAGATDLMLELERGTRKGVDVLVDVSRIRGLDQIALDEVGQVHLGPMVTHNHCVSSKLIREHAYPLAKACWEVGSPQIRNRGTVAGNLITASPANDTIPALMALGASVVLRSKSGNRTVPLGEFYGGVRKNTMRADEMLVDIVFPAMGLEDRGTFIKYALRKAQAISVVNIAIVLRMNGMRVNSASVTLGAVAPTIIHVNAAEAILTGSNLSDEIIQRAAQETAAAARPIDDIRSSAEYRVSMVEVIARRALQSLANEDFKDELPEEPVVLWKGLQPTVIDETITISSADPIVAMVNGKTCTFTSGQHKSLLRLLRDEGHQVGVKEGCAEGECGACTIHMDGAAVMSCMVPAPRAHGAVIVTVEGIAGEGELHPLQQAFIEEDAVQCGYCTPGFIMSGVKLLEEKPHPTKDEIRQALTGNLCRCTGYYNIIHAVEKASERGSQ